MNYNAVFLALSSFDRIGKQSAVRANERTSERMNERANVRQSSSMPIRPAAGCHEIKAFISACERTKLAKRNAKRAPHIFLSALLAPRMWGCISVCELLYMKFIKNIYYDFFKYALISLISYNISYSP